MAPSRMESRESLHRHRSSRPPPPPTTNTTTATAIPISILNNRGSRDNRDHGLHGHGGNDDVMETTAGTGTGREAESLASTQLADTEKSIMEKQSGFSE